MVRVPRLGINMHSHIALCQRALWNTGVSDLLNTGDSEVFQRGGVSEGCFKRVFQRGVSEGRFRWVFQGSVSDPWVAVRSDSV